MNKVRVEWLLVGIGVIFGRLGCLVGLWVCCEDGVSRIVGVIEEFKMILRFLV